MTESQAANYEHGSKMQRDVGIKIIKELKICEGSRVLDLGCGTGYLTKVLSEKVGPQGKVVAVDPDGERLKIAREKYPSSNCEYIQADDKTFPPGEYDIIFSNLVIHWINDKESVFKRVYANLHPGGLFVFTAPSGVHPVPEVGKKIFSTLIGPDFLHTMLNEKLKFVDEREYKVLGNRAGFAQISIQNVDYFPEWKNLDNYIDSMHGCFQGEFDPTQFDQDILQGIRREYGEGPITQSEPIKFVHAILTK